MRYKILLVILGLFLFILILEIELRVGGFILATLQESGNSHSVKQKGEVRIMCIGESTTVWGDSYSYPAQLDNILRERKKDTKFSVINKGVIGTDTSRILANLEYNLNKYSPDMVISMTGINDNLNYNPNEFLDSDNIYFLRFLKTYKLFKLIQLHVINKFKENQFINKKQINNERKLFSIFDWPALFDKESKSKKNSFSKKVQAYWNAGTFYKDQGEISKAEEAFKKIIEINPENARAYVELGTIYMQQYKFIQAKETLDKASKINPGDRDAYLGLGLLYIGEDDLSQAEEAFKKALEIDPREQRAYIWLGNAYKEYGKLSEAEKIFKKAIEFLPRDAALYASLSTILKENNKDKEAQEYLRKAKELNLKYTWYRSVTANNYCQIEKILDKRNIKLICVQYPMRSIEHLKNIFIDDKERIIFVDNEGSFKKAVKKEGYKEYFEDMFAGDFGHCTPKGNKLLADNIFNAILKYYSDNQESSVFE